MEVWFAVSLMELVVLRAAADVQPAYFEIGGSLVLKPKFSGTITGITWKHEGNIVAEWIKDLVPLEYLSDLKGRTELNLTTGALTVSDMKKSDDGLFTVEINNRVLPDGFKAVGVKELGSVQIIMRPPNCRSTSYNCTLTCGGDFKDAGPIKYFYKFGETGIWEEKGNAITISNDEETRQIKSFTCRAKNPISEKESDPEKNPFFPGESSLCSFNTEILGVVIRSVALLFLFTLIVWFCWQNRRVLCRCASRDGDDNQA